MARVSLTTKESTYEGILLESADPAIVVLKLDSGYNVGIAKEKITSKKELKGEKTELLPVAALRHHKGLPMISVLHTGGTIASKVDYATGAVVSRFTPEELVGLFPELENMANIRSRLMANMWSENMRLEHYNLIAKEVEKEIKAGTTGIIITHGTDTMHYSSAALAFILQDCPVPVLFVAAQRSSDRGSTDAEMNLLNAVYFIVHSTFYGVALCMHENSHDENCLILPACKSRKMHSSRRDAFRPINVLPWARVNYRKKNIEEIQKWHNQKGALVLRLFNPSIKVGVLYQRTNMFAEEYLFFEKYDGLVIESTGMGNLPIIKTDKYTGENEKIKAALENLVKTGVVVALSPQTIYGRLHGHVYENEVTQQQMGIIAHLSDMNTETTYIKLAWLLSQYPKEEVPFLLLKNLHGELTERSEENTFLL